MENTAYIAKHIKRHFFKYIGYEIKILKNINGYF